MGRTSKITIATILTLALAQIAVGIAGCASEDTQQALNPAPIPKIAAKSPPAAQSFKNPVIPAKQVSQVTPASFNLIQSTNATERARVVVVSKNRSDPFTQLFGQTVPTIVKPSVKPIPVLPKLPTATVVKAAPVLPKLPTPTAVKPKLPTRTIALTPKKSVPKKLNPPSTPVLPKVLPQLTPNPALASVLPPPAQPELAKAVLVTGVVLISKEPQAIIKVPDEPTSRYVQAGQQLANGVLVKRIEMNGGYNPIVIFEQYGIEVAKMVGEGAVKSTPSDGSGISNPTPVTRPSDGSGINNPTPVTTPSDGSGINNPTPVTTPPQNPPNLGAS